MAVVKANAYGHGAVKVATELQNIGCNDFAVACLSEAQELRNSGIHGNILILGITDLEFIPEVIKGGFIQTTDSLEYTKAVAEHGNAKVHIKIDTGMSRLGFYCHDSESIIKSSNEIEEISKLDNITIDGIFTHFADSDGTDKKYTEKQFSLFTSLIDELKKRNINVGTRHCCNSAGILRYPEMHLDMVRAGIILYGLMPSANVKDDNIKLGMKLSARVCAVHELKKDDCVSYGCTYCAEKDTRVAVISIGYADGFSRVYSGKELLKINGKSYKTVGKICMDMCMVEIGMEPDCKVGDEAIIFETHDEIERLANALGTINYEIVCSVKSRVETKYI